MPEFPKPRFDFSYQLTTEVKRLRDHAIVRKVPKKSKAHLLAATWNIANLGAQDRTPQDLKLIAEILGWFDLVAVQECRDDVGQLRQLLDSLGSSYRLMFSDVGGNHERMVFIYDSRKVKLLEKVGEIAFPPSEYKAIKIKGVGRTFDGFDRTPYLAAFRAGRTSFLFVNVHSYYGSGKIEAVQRRALETLAVARWADKRRRSKVAYTKEIFVMGDFNMPKREPGDPIFDALTRLGLELPKHATEVGTSISTQNNYDQVAYFPGESADLLDGCGVFDYDTVIFRDLWDTRGKKDFDAWLRYYMSDHRPLWVRLKPAQDV
jgi:endonuclease/exonuclease/phosphatase family metal-dependent hydrolase